MKSIPFLVVGPLVFSLAGWIAGKDIFWIITEIPYKVHSNYGSGTLTHYAEQWLLTVGVPLAISSVSGILLLSFHLLARKIKEFPKEYTLLLVLFLANFLFHTLTWYLGLFTAFGLIRIIIPLAPLGALFSLYAMGFLSQQKHRLFKLLTIAFIGFVLIFPFLHNPASFNFKKDFSQKPELLMMKEISQKVKQEYAGYNLYYSEPYFSHAMGINHFDLRLHNNFSEMPLDHIQSPALIIWDIWTSVSFAPYVHDFEHNPDFKLIHSYVNPKDSTEVLFRLYLKE
ncbi:MAG: hypothetical protein IPH45_18580 [Bacteroidales bacterium]|nr:hypothetical protein [Bacteroidales bacterium]